MDIIYYYLYQASRKNKYETNHHAASVRFMGLLLGGFLASLDVGLIFPLLFKPWGVNSEISLLVVVIIALVLGYSLHIYYSKRRSDLINNYDRIYSYKRRNKYLDSLVLFVTFFSTFLGTIMVSSLIRKFLSQLFNPI